MKRKRVDDTKEVKNNHKKLRLTHFMRDSIQSLFLLKGLNFTDLDHHYWKKYDFRIYDHLKLSYGIVDINNYLNFINAGEYVDLVLIDSGFTNIYPGYNSMVISFIQFKTTGINSIFNDNQRTLNTILRDKIHYYLILEKPSYYITKKIRKCEYVDKIITIDAHIKDDNIKIDKKEDFKTDFDYLSKTKSLCHFNHRYYCNNKCCQKKQLPIFILFKLPNDVVHKILDYYIENNLKPSIYYIKGRSYKTSIYDTRWSNGFLSNKMRKDCRFLDVCLTNKFFYKQIQLFYYKNYQWIICYGILVSQKVIIEQSLIKDLHKSSILYDNKKEESIFSQFIKRNMESL